MTDPVSLIGANVLEQMLAYASETPAGPFVEVGVFQGGSAWHLSRLAGRQNRHLWLYDTFTGMPYADPALGDIHPVGDFGDTSFDKITELFLPLPYVHVTRGVFPDICSGDLRFPTEPVAFAHLDVDQYRSYRDACQFLDSRMAKGGVMWFDDLCITGADRAVREMYGDRVHPVSCGKHIVCY